MLAHQEAALWPTLIEQAWKVRENARLYGPTQVGAAVLSLQGNIFVGCNIEHRFRAHDVHAEVNALSSMTAAGDGPAIAIVVAAQRESFTPCGGCMDWIFELGASTTRVAFSGDPNIWLAPRVLHASELMPHYPH